MFEPLRDQPLELIITIGDVSENDMLIFFGQESFIDDGQTRTLHYHFDSHTTWQDLGFKLNWFPSKSQAMRMGWSGAIEPGYSEVKKKLVNFFILNMS